MASKKAFFVSAALAVLFTICLSTSAYGAEQDADVKAYQKAYNLVLSEQWQEAQTAMRQFIKNFPQSKLIDDAEYWKCYTAEKLEIPQEEVIALYDDFIRRYPESNWADDAKKNLLKYNMSSYESAEKRYRNMVWRTLSLQYNKKYQMDKKQMQALEQALRNLNLAMQKKEIDIKEQQKALENYEKALAIQKGAVPLQQAALDSYRRTLDFTTQSILKYQKDDDEEIVLTALHALMNIDEEQALPALIELYDTSDNERIRRSIIEMLARYDSEVAANKIEDIIWNEQDRDIRDAAIRSLAAGKDERRRSILKDVAQSHPDTGSRLSALLVLVRESVSDPLILSALEDIIFTGDSEEDQLRGVIMLRDFAKYKATPLLKKIAQSHPEAKVRLTALNVLAVNSPEDPVLPAVLEEIIFGDADKEDQAAAVRILVRLKDGGNLPLLIKIAKTHKNTNVRKIAIAALGRSADPRAAAALLEIIKKK